MVRGRSERGQVRTAVLCSAGLDSAVLVAAEARLAMVVPLYVSVGFAWEDPERQWLAELMVHPTFRDTTLRPVELRLDMRDIYPATHWARTGHPPAYETPDEDVYIFGRNIVLLTKAAVYCAHQGIHRLAIGPLAGNPFPDATPQFFSTFGAGLSLGLAHSIEVVAPFRDMHKSDVILLGQELDVPLALTLSCMNPNDRAHCGACSKCRERQEAFREAGVSDPTPYAVSRTQVGSHQS